MKWISVKNRLPEAGVDVLCLDDERRVYLMTLEEGGWLWSGVCCATQQYVNPPNPDESGVRVHTHWMPMPDLPEDRCRIYQKIFEIFV